MWKVKCEMWNAKGQGKCATKSTREPKWWCRQGGEQYQKCAFFILSLSSWFGPISSLTTFSLVYAMCQASHHLLKSSFGVHWPKREPPSWKWLDHLSYNLKWHMKLTYMWGPLLPKGELEFCVHGENWVSFLILCYFKLFSRLSSKPFLN